MNFILIIIGALLTIFCGIVYLATNTAIKNQDNWDDFYKSVEEKNLPVPEETVYNLVCKMNFWFCIGFIIGIIALIGGLLLTFIK